MKPYIFLFLIIPCLSSAQIKTDSNGFIYYEEVHEVSSLSQTEIKEKVHEWFATSYNDSNNVIKMNTDGKIVANGLFTFSLPYKSISVEQKISYSIITEFKDGRYKVLINNLTSDQNYPISDPPMNGYDAFKAEYAKTVAKLSGAAKRENEKILKNEKKLRALYDEGIGMQTKIANKVKNEIAAIAKNLENYVAKSDEGLSDW